MTGSILLTSRTTTANLLNFSNILLDGCFRLAKSEAACLPHGTQDDTRMCHGKQDDRNGHHHAVEDHEFDLVVGDGSMEASAELSHSERASDENGDGANADGWSKTSVGDRAGLTDVTYTTGRT